jgi:hypothetical protein
MYEKLELFFEKHNVKPKKANARSYIFDCPACGGNEKLYIEKSSGRSICFKHKTEECPTAKTGIIHTLHLLSEVPHRIIKEELSDKIITTQEEVLSLEDEVDLEIENQKKKELSPIDVKQLPFDCKPIDWPEAKEGLDYLTGRGLDLETLKRQNVMYSNRYRRVIFPVIMNGEMYGWQGRAVDKNNPLRMYNLPGEWKTKTLMFFDNLKGSDKAILAEGAISALKFSKVGGFVATMGKVISQKQIDMVLDLGVKKVYLALDPDAINEMEDLTKRLLMQTKYKVECFLIKVPVDKEDFGDCSYDECVNAYQTSIKLDLSGTDLYSYAVERM